MDLQQRPKRRGTSPWMWIFGFVWVAVLLFAVVGVGRSFIEKARTAQKQIADPSQIGPDERSFFLTPDELGEAGIWKPESASPEAPSVSRIKAGSEPYYISTYKHFAGNPGVVQTAGIVAGPSWVAKMAFHTADKSRQQKEGYEERVVEGIGSGDYSAWRYCKGDFCHQFIAMAASEGKIVSVTVIGDAHPDLQKLDAVLKSAMARIEVYKVMHRNR